VIPTCQCNEGIIEDENTGERKPIGLYVHDCAYIAWRNDLIPRAEKRASEIFDRLRNAAEWSSAFHREMNHLVENERSKR